MPLNNSQVIEQHGRRYVLFAGLLALAHEEGLKSVVTTLVQIPHESNGMLAITHARVETSKGTFDGIGDASPGNVGRAIAPHIIRMSETRAVARAFRVAVNVGEALADDPINLGDVEIEEAGGPERPHHNGEAAVRQASIRESPPRAAAKKESPRQWYERMAPVARTHGILAPTLTSDAPDDFVMEKCQWLKAELQAKVTAQ